MGSMSPIVTLISAQKGQAQMCHRNIHRIGCRLEMVEWGQQYIGSRISNCSTHRGGPIVWKFSLLCMSQIPGLGGRNPTNTVQNMFQMHEFTVISWNLGTSSGGSSP